MTTATRVGARVAVQLEPDEREQFQRAARLLLAHPLVTESWPRPGALGQVRRWETVLKAELLRVLGYRLDVGRTCARLYRRPATISTTRGARTRTDRPMGPLSCSFLCLALAALESLGDQTTASHLSNEILRLRSGDDALPIDLTKYDQRRAFVDAVKWLEDRGVLRLCDGEVERWLSDEDSGDALYDIDGDALSRLLVASPSVLRDVGDVTDFLAEPYAPSEDGQRNRLRHRLGRRLINDPVLSYVDLDPDELAHIRHRRTRIVSDIELLTGCSVEARAEGLLLVDTAVEPLSKTSFPSTGTETQAALLWGSALVENAAPIENTANSTSFSMRGLSGPSFERDAAAATSPWRVVPSDVAAQLWDEIVAVYRARFRVEYRDAPDRLYEQVVALLVRYGLLSLHDGPEGVTFLCHAAMARYRPGAMDGTGDEQPPESSLFDLMIGDEADDG